VSTAVHRLHFDLDDQIAERYPQVPFEVRGEGSVEVTLAYEGEGAVVDLGCEDPERWRGWSGGARSRFVIGRDAATPGYEPGELPDGRWAVVLGLHAIPAAGVDVTVTVTLPAEGPVEDDPPAPPAPSAARGSERGLPAPAGLTWFAGDFHCHSLHSDGDQSLAQVAARAVGHGLDFLAMTEHNTVSHHPHLAGVGAAYDLSLLPGQEVTTARGHANAFGDIGFIDFRAPADTWEPEVEARGGFLSINHPIEGDCSWLHPLPSLPPAIELWHIGWFRDLRSTAPWAYWRHWRPDAVLLGGSDFHDLTHAYPPGTPTTWVLAEDRTPDAVFAAVLAGRTAIAIGPAPGTPTLLRLDEDLIAIDADGTVLVDIDGRRTAVHGSRVSLPAGDAGTGPFRLESADRTLLAVSR